MACCQPKRPGVGGMKRCRELADGRQAQLSSGVVGQLSTRSGGGQVPSEDQVADSKPGMSCRYWNTWRVVYETMRELGVLWGTGGRRDDSSTPVFGWRSV